MAVMKLFSFVCAYLVIKASGDTKPSGSRAFLSQSHTAAEVDYNCDSICTITDSSRTLTITNNCQDTVNVQTDAGNYGSCQWSGSKVPPCLKELKSGASAEVQLLNDNPGWGFAWQIGSFGNSTRFELTCEADQYYWDVSYNAGFDIGMTVAPPGGRNVVVTDSTAPAAYQRGATSCQVQPCASPTFAAASGSYELFLCNRPDDVNTPGPCGCDACPGISCSEGEPDCSTSGGGIWCLTGGPNCPTKTSPPGTTCSGMGVTLPQFMLARGPTTSGDSSLAVVVVNNYVLQAPCGNTNTLTFFEGYNKVDLPGAGQQTTINIPLLFGQYQIGFQTNGWYWAAVGKTPSGNCINPDNAGNVGLIVAADCSSVAIAKNFGYTCDDSYVPNASDMVTATLISSSPCTVEVRNTGDNLPVTDQCCSCETCTGDQIPADQEVRCW